MKTRLFFIFLTCFLLVIFDSNPLSAQSDNYEKGYYINLEGERVDGWIYDNGDYYLYKKVLFKNDLSEKVIAFDPSNIQAFGFQVHRYISAEIEHFLFKDKLFLREIVLGPLSLYGSYDSKQDKVFVIKDQSGRWIPLIKSSLSGLLKSTLTACDNIKLESPGDIPKFTEKALSELIIKYNQCIDSSVNIEQKAARKSVIKKWVFAGGGPRAIRLGEPVDAQGDYEEAMDLK